MNFKHHITAHFSSCRHLADAYDPYRKRDVKLFALPGEFDYVGVFDGTDDWVAPASPSCFTVDTMAILRRLRAGEDVRPVTNNRVRIRPVQQDLLPTTTGVTRVKVIARVQVHA